MKATVAPSVKQEVSAQEVYAMNLDHAIEVILASDLPESGGAVNLD